MTFNLCPTFLFKMFLLFLREFYRLCFDHILLPDLFISLSIQRQDLFLKNKHRPPPASLPEARSLMHILCCVPNILQKGQSTS